MPLAAISHYRNEDARNEKALVPPAAACEVQRIGELEIDYRAHVLYVNGERVEMTAKEWGLLTVLASDPRRAFTRNHLMRSVWGHSTSESSRTLDAHACRLRAKLSTGSHRYVINLWGVGYRLVDSPPDGAAGEIEHR